MELKSPLIDRALSPGCAGYDVLAEVQSFRSIYMFSTYESCPIKRRVVARGKDNF